MNEYISALHNSKELWGKIMATPKPGDKRVYYLASPYSNPDPAVVEARYEAVLEASVQLMNKGFILMEPIAQSHDKAKRYTLPTNFEYWQRANEAWINKSDGVIVCLIDGWKESRGVQSEIAYAESKGQSVYYYDGKGEFRTKDELAGLVLAA